MLESSNTWVDETHSDNFVHSCVILMTRYKMVMITTLVLIWAINAKNVLGFYCTVKPTQPKYVCY